MQTILVLGGTGKTGRRVIERLTAKGVQTRSGSRAGVPPFEWGDRTTWAPVMQDVRAVYLSYQPDLAVPGAVDDVRAFTDLAAKSGVERLVLLSGRGEEEAAQAERVIQASELSWTILRSSFFAQNFSEGLFADSLQYGELALPSGSVSEPFIDVEDIADVAAAALTEPGHDSEVYVLTGPRLLSFADAVGEISRAAGRPMRYESISAEAFKTSLGDAGLPPEVIDLLAYLFTEVLDGRNAHVEDGVRRALGREPRDFTDYARATAATGVWGDPTVKS